MLVPIGLDETRIARVPWISIAILALCVVAHVATSLAPGDDAADARYREVIGYWREHPYLSLPVEVGRRFGLSEDELARATRAPRQVPLPSGAQALQERLDGLCAELVEALDAVPARRFGLVPARGLLQPGWITHLFVHGGLLHLLGNLLVFALVVAPFLEDAWGRPFFLAFYLAGGAAAGAAQALAMGDSPVPIVGASGAISACLGAFAVRFAHRRVRIFYWLFFVLVGTFFVPAWLYAFVGLGLDLLGLALAGSAGGVAYAAHVGGFAFGLAAALAVRASGLEARLAPEGTARVGRTLSASRAADALADGRVAEARHHLEEALRRDPADADSLLALARIHAAAFDRPATTAAVDRLLALHLGKGDRAAARAVLADVGNALDPALLRPATAYRAAEVGVDDALAARLDEAAGRGGGALGAKALLRAAERLRVGDPARAHALAERAAGAEGAPADVRARAAALARDCAATRAAARPSDHEAEACGGGLARDAAVPRDREVPALGGGLAPDAPVRLVHCRLLGASEAGLDLATEHGDRATLAPAEVAALAAAVVAEHALAGRPVRNAVLLDVLLRARAGERERTVLRLAGHEMALAAIHPGVPPPQAFGQVVDALLAASGAAAAPSPQAAAGRPFARFGDATAFETAAWGRALGA